MPAHDVEGELTSRRAPAAHTLPHSRAARALPHCIAAMSLLGGAAAAQTAGGTGGGSAVTVSPSFSVTETVTDNRDLTTHDRHADSITQISPGIRVVSNGGRVQGSLDYTLNALVYAKASDKSTIQHALSALGAAELVENHVFVDGQATVSQQAVSAFGTRVGPLAFVNDNATTVTTLAVSPWARGSIGGVVDVTARLSWSGTHAESTDDGDTRNAGAQLSFGGGRGVLGWGLSLGRTVTQYSADNKQGSNYAIASLSYAGIPDMRWSVRGGHEGSDLQRELGQSARLWGWGVDWSPSPRTALSFQTDDHAYGRSHNFSFAQRWARSFWSYTNTRSISQDPLEPGIAQFRTVFLNTFNACLRSGVAATICDQFVRQVFGLGPTVPLGFLSTGQSLQEMQNLTLGMAMPRTTVTLSATQSANHRLEGAVYSGGDLALVDEVRQLGLSLGVTHSLTPVDSLSLNASQYRTFDSGTQPGNLQRVLYATWSRTLSSRSSGSISARHTIFDSESNPYRETALIGSWTLRF